MPSSSTFIPIRSSQVISRKFSLAFLCAVFFFSTKAFSQSRTKIRDVFTSPSGATLNGQITVMTTTSFTTLSGTTVPAGQRVVVPVKNGVFSIDLWPNVGSTPANTSYTVELAFGATPTVEIWVIPSTSSVLNRASVVGSIVPLPKTQVNLNQITQSGAVNGQAPIWNGTTKQWEPTNVSAVGNLITSVFGRTGAVVSSANDYSAGQVSNSPAGSVSSTTVQSAINELDAEKASLSHAHSTSDLTSGTLPLARGGTASNLSSTGGTGQYLKQSSSGAVVTVGTIAASDIPSSVDAVKIANGTVTNANFQNLAGVTSAIQTQLDARITGSATANRTAYWDGTSSQSGMSGTTWTDGSRLLQIENSTDDTENVQIRGGTSSQNLSPNRAQVVINTLGGAINNSSTALLIRNLGSSKTCGITTRNDVPEFFGCNVLFGAPVNPLHSYLYPVSSFTRIPTAGVSTVPWPSNSSASGSSPIGIWYNLSANLTINMSTNAPAALTLSDGYYSMLEICQDATGGRTVTLGTGFDRVSSFAVNTAPNKCTILQLIYRQNVDRWVKLAPETSY